VTRRGCQGIAPGTCLTPAVGVPSDSPCTPTRMRRFLGMLVVLATSMSVVAGRPVWRASAVELLDSYLRGNYTAATDALSDDANLDDLLTRLRQDGPAWIEGGGSDARTRRELAAATLALEAARAGEWREWKIRTKMQLPSDGAGVPRPPTIIMYWRAPALLLEWGCELMRQGHQPSATERLWFQASVAVAERAEDYEFMVGDTKLDEMADRRVYEYNGDVIQHVRHAMLRFPQEPRFNLAQAIAEEGHDPPAAVQRFTLLQKDIDLRGEATVRLGVMAYWQRDDDRALDLLRRSEGLTRDPWLIYLARFVSGLIQERHGHSSDAESLYRRALMAVPRAESGVVSLAALLFRSDRREEAERLTQEMLATRPAPADPWRGYADADDRFWPQLVGGLREAIAR
jgi:hypothetical protein